MVVEKIEFLSAANNDCTCAVYESCGRDSPRRLSALIRVQRRCEVRLTAAISAFCLLTLGVPVVLAHHGNSAYDEKDPITLKGTVTEFDFVNPHSQIYLDVKDDKGNVVHWAIESQSPGIMVKNDWTRHTLKPGDEITITLIPAKNGSPVGFSGASIGKVVLPDGKTMTMQKR
jgi:hypothetical protein